MAGRRRTNLAKWILTRGERKMRKMTDNSSRQNATRRMRRGSSVMVENAAGKITIYATGSAEALVRTDGGQPRREKRAACEATRQRRARQILADLRTGTVHLRRFTIQQSATIDSAMEVRREVRAPLFSVVNNIMPRQARSLSGALRWSQRLVPAGGTSARMKAGAARSRTSSRNFPARSSDLTCPVATSVTVGNH